MTAAVVILGGLLALALGAVVYTIHGWLGEVRADRAERQAERQWLIERTIAPAAATAALWPDLPSTDAEPVQPERPLTETEALLSEILGGTE